MRGTDNKVVTGRLRVKVTECFLVELHDTSYKKVNIALSHLKRQNSIVLMTLQGCGNTMPDLSDLVPFHSGQVENFYILVL